MLFLVLYKCNISFTAEEAYDLLEQWQPDIILIDIKLIGATGVDFIRKIRKDGVKTPVIVITAYKDNISDLRRKGLKIDGYFEKPYSYARLYKTIKEILEVA